MTDSSIEYVRMFDGLWYPREVLEDTAPNLFRYRQDHDSLDESFDFPPRFAKPKSFLHLCAMYVFYLILSMLLAVLFVIYAVLIFGGTFLSGLFGFLGVAFATFFWCYCMAGLSGAYHGPYILRFTDGKLYQILPNETSPIKGTILLKSFKYEKFKITRGNTRFAVQPWLGAHPFSFDIFPRKCHRIEWFSSHRSMAVGLTPETDLLWEEFMLLRETATGTKTI